jgi:adenylate kinase family enzyme
LTIPPRIGIRAPMRRIIILGNAGSGKSTLARRLGERLGLPVVHLDVLFWRPGWVEPENEGFRARVREAVAGDAWITDGNYVGRTFDLRMPRADLVIWLDTPQLTCVGRALMRTAIGAPRADLAEGCKERLWDPEFFEFLRYTWDYDKKSRPRIEAARQAAAPDTPVVHLKTQREIDAFVASAS